MGSHQAHLPGVNACVRNSGQLRCNIAYVLLISGSVVVRDNDVLGGGGYVGPRPGNFVSQNGVVFWYVFGQKMCYLRVTRSNAANGLQI